jgi:holo-[acyl-carrier protein] synthase
VDQALTVRGVGVDVSSIDRMALWIERYPGGELEMVFTAEERQAAAGSPRPAVALAASFAGKEAVVKALGVGFDGIAPLEVEALPRRRRLALRLRGRARVRAEALGIERWLGAWWQTQDEVVTGVIAL